MIFASVETLAAIRIYTRGHAVATWALPLLLTITVMEYLEVAMWLDVLPLSSLQAGLPCPSINKYALLAGGAALWAQPLCGNLFGYKTSKENQAGFRVLLIISAITFFAGILQLVLPLICSKIVPGLTAEELSSIYHMGGAHTCTYEGPSGHLLWKFAVGNAHTLALLPNLFVYFILFVVPLALFYRPWGLGVTISTSLIGIAIVSALWLQTAEFFSVYCWQGIVLHAVFVFVSYIPHPKQS